MMSTMEIIVYVLIFLFTLISISCFLTKKKSKTLKDKNVVITGGSSGIGLECAKLCVKAGASSVTLIARNVQLLEKAVSDLEKYSDNPDQKIQYKSLDISKSYEDVAKCMQEIETRQGGEINVLINCAGMAICGILEEVSIEDAKKLMDINYFGTYYCIRYVLPKMKKSHDGIIVITASQAALMGIYGYGCYTVAKFALRGLAETIAMEAKHFGVSVTLALPADTDTPGFENEEKTKPIETKIISGSGGLAKPEDVAKQIILDSVNGCFFSIMGMESWIITSLCCGMAPWGGILLNIFLAIVMGPLRIISCGLQWHFGRIVKNCAKQKQQ